MISGAGKEKCKQREVHLASVVVEEPETKLNPAASKVRSTPEDTIAGVDCASEGSERKRGCQVSLQRGLQLQALFIIARSCHNRQTAKKGSRSFLTILVTVLVNKVSVAGECGMVSTCTNGEHHNRPENVTPSHCVRSNEKVGK
jgi:hypothetical protein